MTDSAGRSESDGRRAYARDAFITPSLGWLGLAVLFLGCGSGTVAVVSLAGDKTISVIAAAVAGPFVLIGLISLFIDGKRQLRDRTDPSDAL